MIGGQQLIQHATPLLTVHAYYHFITTYKGAVAGWSVIFLLIALVCCIGLVVNSNWWMHLRFMYLLFASYITWDILMLELVLKPDRFQADSALQCTNDLSEIRSVNSFINVPTLGTIFIVSLFCESFIKKGHVPDETVKIFVAGVVSFHLFFSSLAYLYLRIVREV